MKQIIALVSMLTVFLSTSVFAAAPNNTVDVNQYFYASATAGLNYNYYSDLPSAIVDRDHRSEALGLNVGYRFNQSFATEFGGLYFTPNTIGKIKSSGVTVETIKAKRDYVMYLLAKGIIDLNSQFDLFAKAGPGLSHAKDAGTGVVNTSKSYTRIVGVVGLGSDYHITSKWDASLEGLYVSKNGNDIPSHFVALLGLAYRFV